MEIKTEALVIGSGIAGLYAAIKIAEFSDVLLITKKKKADSNTNYAQGGIASVIDKQDSFEKHINDTLIAGDGLCDKKSVEIMVQEGPDRIKELIEIGVEFTKKKGKLDLAREGGHSLPRILHSSDLTGREIERALIEFASSKKNLEIKENFLAIDLITEHNIKKLKKASLNNRHVWGIYALDLTTNKVVQIISKVTVLATGGLGQVYLHTTNPTIATGDGLAMAYRAGAKLANTEFIQFHPTSLYQADHYKNSQAFLITEAVRGFGGILRTKDGKKFMHKYDKRKELSPRDIVARAIDNELKKRGDDFVYLDISHKSKNEILEHFPNIFKKCSEIGIDISKQMIPVVPSAHYFCGGIIVGKNSNTSLSGLYAAGEVAMTGVHGANRLASNSLLEALVFSKRGADDIKQFLKNYKEKIPSVPGWDDSGTLTADEKILITHSLREVQQLMWNYVGIVRSNMKLERAAKRINTVYLETEELYKRTKIFDEILTLRNIITCSHIIIKSSTRRKESRGLHYTLDYPYKKSRAKNIIIQNTHP